MSSGALALVCLTLYLIPRTSVLGAILLTGYLGGAVATQVRVGKWLRDDRLRLLVPLRTQP
jgi:hypothetical protein